MDVMLVVDMQIGLLQGDPKYDLTGVVDRINHLSAKIRGQSGRVIFVQHTDARNKDFVPGSSGWQLLPELTRDTSDIVVRKHLNDPFAGTGLQAWLNKIAPDRLLVTGWATDLCVDATVRSAVANGHNVIAVADADAHTLSDRPHLDAVSVIRHHNWIWRNLITERAIDVIEARRLLS
jgi:nicotinamidase-related amidase